MTSRSLAFRALIPTLILLIWALQPANAQTYSVLYAFDGYDSTGAGPLSLLRNSQGDLFGITDRTNITANPGFGVFFKLSGSSETVLHEFSLDPRPMGQIARDAAGNFYGTTYYGGTSAAGTIYKMDKTGNVTTLFSFHQYVGANPEGGVIIDSAGNLYGTTSAGGGTTCECGVVFELSSTGKYTVLHRFAGGTDGSSPQSGLLRDSLGNLYGTTAYGGGGACTSGCGTVFKVSAADVEKVIHRFAGGPNDGANPLAGLTRDSAGTLYGTTTYGGAGAGTVFKIDTAGQLTILHIFRGGYNDGAFPMAPLVFDSGNLYGTTYQGGTGCCPGVGTIFELDNTGVFTVLHSFGGGPDGKLPKDGLILGSDGKFYGTTWRGGGDDAGTVFRIAP